MNLIIKKHLKWQKNSKIFEMFLNNIFIPELYIYALGIMDVNQIVKWDKYFKNNYQWNVGDYPPNTYDILIQGISNLTCYNYKDYYLITIKSNQIIPKTTAKLYDICAEINYGNLFISAYPIFNKIFNYAQNIIEYLFQQYWESLGG